jgi:hypothetical protein
MSMYLLIRHELNKETEAKRGEVAEAKAGNRQRDACLQMGSGSDKHSTLRSLSQTQAKTRAKDRTHRWGHTRQWLRTRERSDRHQPTRAWKALGPVCQSTPCECACTGKRERERSRMRHNTLLHLRQGKGCGVCARLEGLKMIVKRTLHHGGRGKAWLARAACLGEADRVVSRNKEPPAPTSIPFLIQEKEPRRAGHQHKHKHAK